MASKKLGITLDGVEYIVDVREIEDPTPSTSGGDPEPGTDPEPQEQSGGEEPEEPVES